MTGQELHGRLEELHGRLVDQRGSRGALNTPGLATLDAGFKALSTDGGHPSLLNGAPPGTAYQFIGDEHGLLILPEDAVLPLVHHVTLGAPHCDPTANLYDTYHVVHGDTVRALWPVSARGRSR